MKLFHISISAFVMGNFVCFCTLAIWTGNAVKISRKDKITDLKDTLVFSAGFFIKSNVSDDLSIFEMGPVFGFTISFVG